MGVDCGQVVTKKLTGRSDSVEERSSKNLRKDSSTVDQLCGDSLNPMIGLWLLVAVPGSLPSVAMPGPCHFFGVAVTTEGRDEI